MLIRKSIVVCIFVMSIVDMVFPMNLQFSKLCDKRIRSVVMSQKDLRSHTEYSELPKNILQKIIDYHLIDKTDQRMLILRTYKLKEICYICYLEENSVGEIIESVFNIAAAKHNYLVDLNRNLSIFRNNPLVGFINYFFKVHTKRNTRQLYLIDLESYRCAIDPYCNDYGARRLFDTWLRKCNSEEKLPSFFMWLEQFDRQDFPAPYDFGAKYPLEFRSGMMYMNGEILNEGLVNFILSIGKKFYVSAVQKHTKLSTGKPVLSAGEFLIKNGKIIEVNDQSGHYLPGIPHILEALYILRQYDCLHENCLVRFLDTYSIADKCAHGGICNMPTISVHDMRSFTLMPYRNFLDYADKRAPRILWNGDGPEFDVIFKNSYVGKVRFTTYFLYRDFVFHSFLPGKLIMIFGVPSSGKTTMICELRTKLKENFAFTGHDDILHKIFREVVIEATKESNLIDELSSLGNFDISQFVEFPELIDQMLSFVHEDNRERFKHQIFSSWKLSAANYFFEQIEKSLIPMLRCGYSVITDVVESKFDPFLYVLYKNLIHCDYRRTVLYCSPLELITRINKRNSFALAKYKLSDIRFSFPFKNFMDIFTPSDEISTVNLPVTISVQDIHTIPEVLFTIPTDVFQCVTIGLSERYNFEKQKTQMYRQKILEEWFKNRAKIWIRPTLDGAIMFDNTKISNNIIEYLLGKLLNI